MSTTISDCDKKTKPELTAARVREVLDYEPETGLLRWRVARSGCGMGKVAGSKNRYGYIQVAIDYHTYQSHRIAWLHMHGVWPANEIDHINGVRDDNRMANLRDVSRQVNAQNQRKAKHGEVINPSNTGKLGTCFDRERQVFRAQITDPVTRKQKNLGRYATAAEAHQVYLEAKRRLHEGNTL